MDPRLDMGIDNGTKFYISLQINVASLLSSLEPALPWRAYMLH